MPFDRNGARESSVDSLVFVIRKSQSCVIAALAMALAICGCGGRGATTAPVDPARAKDALTTVLDAWKSGQKPQDLRSRSPEIVVRDFDWEAGAKLSDYKVTENSKPQDANLISEVQLTLVMPDGKKAQKSVKYMVGTDRTLTVHRKLVD